MIDATGPHVHIDLRAASAHLVEVELRLQPRQPILRLALPAWTPGSYLIRDYVRQLEGLQLEQAGQPVPLRRMDVAAWQADLPGLAPLTLRYRLLAPELTVRTSHLDADHGFLCLAAVVLAVEGERWQPHHLSLALPEGWQPFLPLPQQPDGSWRARDFDQLIDTPIEAGPHCAHAFTVGGVNHRWVTWGNTLAGRDPLEADPALLGDLERVCGACCRLMGEDTPAADDYLFVLHLTDNGYGGLEHDQSSVLQYGRRRLIKPDGRRKLLQLVAHEYLHQWNVRRLRPAELTPYAYDRPTIVPTLWFAEGITSYFDQFLPLTAGCSTEAELFEDLGMELSRYRQSPGRAVQSLVESAEEAWVKLYKADAYAISSQVSYYLKGAILALVLDLHLRRHGSGLPAVLRRLWQRFGRLGRGYRQSDLLAAFAEGAADLQTLLPQWLSGYEDPDVDTYLAEVGLRLRPQMASEPWLGWQVEATAGGGLQLQRVLRDGPAERAGLMVADELVAVAGWRVQRLDELVPLLAAQAGSPGLPVAFARDGRLRQCELRPDPPRVERWHLEPDVGAPPSALERRRQWLALEVA